MLDGLSSVLDCLLAGSGVPDLTSVGLLSDSDVSIPSFCCSTAVDVFTFEVSIETTVSDTCSADVSVLDSDSFMFPDTDSDVLTPGPLSASSLLPGSSLAATARRMNPSQTRAR